MGEKKPRRTATSRASGRRRSVLFPSVLALALMVALVWGSAPAAYAASFTVNDLGDAADVSPGNGVCATAGGVCTLRAAIQEANAWGGANTITFSVNGTILLTGALPWIWSDVTITGPGANLLYVDGGNSYQVFGVGSATVTISRLTVQNGYLYNGSGAGIFNAGALTVRDCVVRANNVAGSSGSGNLGAGIYSQGTLTVQSSQVVSNTIQAPSSVSGGGIANSSGTALISGTLVADNTALCTDPSQGAAGGGVYNGGTIRIRNSTIRNNSAQNSSGSWGGGIYNGGFATAYITDTQILHNDARAGGGISNFNVLHVTGGTFHGNVVDIDGGGLRNEFGSAVTLNGVTLDGNYSGTRGGAVYNESSGQVTLDNCIVSNNTGINNGGGLYNGQNGSPLPVLTLNNTQVLTNTSPGGGGGVYNCATLNVTGGLFSGNQATGFSYGGGIYNFCPGLATATISGATVQHNSATSGAGIFNWSVMNLTNSFVMTNTASSYGGGIYQNSATLNIVNTSILTNTAGSQGGGIYIYGSGPTLDGVTVRQNQAPSGAGIYNSGGLQLNNSNLDGNIATTAGGGLFSGYGATLGLQNTTVSGNRAPNGAGVYVERAGLATIDGGTLTGNQATGAGGGLYNNGSTVTIGNNAAVTGNSASDWLGGGLYNGTYMWSEIGTLNVADSEVGYNAGGGIYNDGTLNVSGAVIENNDIGVYADQGNVQVITTWVTGNQMYGFNFGTLGTINAVLGGSPANANHFAGNGPFNVHVQTPSTNPPINALWNYWGVDPLQDVENTIWHRFDNNSLAQVDYYTLTMVAAPATQVADGVSPVLITSTLTGWFSPMAGDTIAFATGLGALGSPTATTDGSGRALNSLTSLTTGRAYITATTTMDTVAGRAAYANVLFTSLQADLNITKTDGQTTAVPGQSVTYTIVAGNAGPGDAPGSIVTDNFPAALTGVTWNCSGSGGGACPANGSGNINATVDLPAGGSVTFLATGTVDPAATGTLVNTAAVTTPAGLGDPDPGNNSATDTDTLAPRADLSIDKSVSPANAMPGQPITYSIAFSNNGPSLATGIVITDIVPVTLTNIGVSSSGVAIVDTGHAPPYVWTAADMLPGVTGYITITAGVDPALSADTSFVNVAQIDSPLESNPADNSAQAGLSVTVPRVSFSSTAYSVAEDGGAAPIAVTLDTPNPYADVTVVYSTTNGTAQAGQDYVGVRATLTIPAGSPSASFSVAILDDFVYEGNETILLSLSNPTGAQPGSPSAATLTIVDDDGPGVVVTPTSGLVTTESGGSAAFQVYLLSQPTAQVTIDLASSDTSEGTVGPAQLVFDAGNWATPQTATVTGVDDPAQDGNVFYTITTALTSADPGYAQINPPDVSVINLDDDAPGVYVNPTSGLVTTEAGGSDTFQVYLQSQPAAAVTIDLGSSDLTEGSVAPLQLVFDAGNWATPQTVTVTGVDDQLVDGSVPYTIVTTLTSADPNYAPIDPSDVGVTNLDDDTAGVAVAPTAGLVTTESGGTAAFQVYLLSQPAAQVTIDLASSDLSEGTVAPAQLVFDAGNWSTPQVATVTGVDDQVVDGNIPYTIVTSLASVDPAYALLDPADVAVVNMDDDQVSGAYYVYLPVLLKAGYPDLNVASLTWDPLDALVGEPVTITLQIINQGRAAVDHPFWVDLYIDPDPALMPPQVNQTWDMVGSRHGIAWLVDQPIAPGEAITITSLSYSGDYSDWSGYFDCFGPHALYAQVDSYGGASPFGGINELDETNNVIGPIVVPVACPGVGSCSSPEIPGGSGPAPRPLP